MSGISIFSSDKRTKFKKLQLNYWIYKPKWKIKSKSFLDIGVEMEAGNKHELSIFFPGSINGESIQCIGKHLKGKALADVLFNESCKVSEHNMHSFLISFGGEDKERSIEVCTFEKSKFTLDKMPEGRLFKVTISASEHHRYIRLRIDLSNLSKQFADETKPLGSWLQSIRTQNREVDFRVNSLRSIPQVIHEDETKHLAKFEAIHFFYITSSDESILFQNTPIASARFLENQTWKQYFGKELNTIDKICAHHWKFKNPKEVALFFRANFKSTNWLTILWYLSFTAVFAVAVNLLSSVIYTNYISGRGTQKASTSGAEQTIPIDNEGLESKEILPNDKPSSGRKGE